MGKFQLISIIFERKSKPINVSNSDIFFFLILFERTKKPLKKNIADGQGLFAKRVNSAA